MPERAAPRSSYLSSLASTPLADCRVAPQTDEAHGPEISAALEETSGRNLSRGALYSALARLERKGFLTWNIVASSDARGGSPNRCFSVTSDGIIALRAVRRWITRRGASGKSCSTDTWYGMETFSRAAGRIIRRLRVRRRLTLRAALLTLIVASGGGAAGAGGATQELPVEDLLARVQENYRGQSMRARFEQRQETRPGMAPKIGTGSWLMGAPGLMRVEYDDTGRVMVTDGEKLYWYLPEEKQVHIRLLDEFSQRGNALLYLSGQGDLLEDFAVSGTEWRTKLAPGNIQLRLEPLVDGTNFSYLLLEIEPDAAMIVRLVIFGLFGDANEFRFTDIERDTDLADELFRFTIPPGVDVENLGN